MVCFDKWLVLCFMYYLNIVSKIKVVYINSFSRLFIDKVDNSVRYLKIVDGLV